MDSTGGYPEWFASGGSWLNGNNKGTSVVWVAPTDPGVYTIWVKDDDLPTAIVPPHTGSRNDAPASSAAVSTLDLTITLGHDLWWFNGCDAAYYYEGGTLTLNGISSGDFTWNVVQGTDKINFGNGTDQQVVSNNNSVSFYSTAGSAVADDVKVEVTVSGVSGKASKLLTVYMPKKLTHISDNDEPWGTWGYRSHIWYSIQDNTDRTMVNNIEINEQWTGDVVADYTDMDWFRGATDGATRPGNGWDDKVGITTTGTLTPMPLNPSTPLGTTKVCHWPGDWYVGSETPGQGVKVHSTVWQRYQDHARHEDP